MKRLFNIMGCLAAFAGIVAGVASCTPTYDHRGGPFNPDEGPGRDAGGGGGGGEKKEVITLEYGYADYWGQYYTEDTDNYLLYLYAGDTDEDGYFKSKGIILTLDMLLPLRSNLSFYSHEYSLSDGGEPFTFIPTYPSRESDYEGSTLYIQNSADNYGTYKITGGVVEITKKGVTGNYVINASIVVGQQTYEFHFEGYLDIQDMTETDPGGDEPQDRPEFPGPEGSEWAARALFQGHLDDNKTDEYTLYLSLGDYAANGDFKTSGSEIAIELFTGYDAGNSIAYGTYKCISSDPEPFTFYDGYFWTDDDGNEYLEPSYFYRQYDEGDSSLEAITNGTLEVKQGTNGGYHFTFAYSTASNSYKIYYDGAVKFEKANRTSGQTKAAGLKAARSFASGRISPSVKREVHRNIVARQQ